ncbi:MAG: hypothetical protein PHS37_04310 [Candidatus Omnitrophica bacterium]|nr:hypothetical protein [Candidatus Omnitrophota bacterium]
MKKISVLCVAALFLLGIAFSEAASRDSGDLIKQGLLGAGAGAVGGAVSGGKGGDLWKGALAGAGVNIVGGALLDSISGEKVDTVDNVQRMQPQDAYSQGYNEGFGNGYKQGYTQGYQEGVKEGARSSVQNEVRQVR